MGNSSHRDGDLTIYIQTEKSFYNSGSFIEGVVFVDAKKHFAFDALYIRVEGDEWCQWFEGSSKNRQKYTGSQNFFAVQHCLENFPNCYMEPGRYAYPFSLELSENIPGSFQSGPHEGKIQYKLAAYFMNYKQPNNREIEYVPLVVREPFRQEIISYQGQSSQEPKSCWCCGSGRVGLQAVFEKNVAYEEELVHIDITVDNREGDGDINKVQIELMENIFVCSNEGSNRTYRESKHSETAKQPVPQGQAVKFGYDFKVPTVDHQTSIGTLVANHYRLQVSTQESFVSTDNPCVYAPLFILKRELDAPSNTRPGGLSEEWKDYKRKRPQVFKAPEYWFKKNQNLSVMNFRLEDMEHV